MTSRKKPQQELASYLDELLTELEEPSQNTDQSSVPVSPRQPKQLTGQLEKNIANESVYLDKGTGPSSPKNKDESKPDTPVASAPKASTPTVSIPKKSPLVVNEVRVHKAAVNKKVSTPTGEATTGEMTTTKAKTAKQEMLNHTATNDVRHTPEHTVKQGMPVHAATLTSPQMLLQEKKQRTPDADLDLRQREKERLARLLNSLPPTMELPSLEAEPKKVEQPVDTIVVKVKTRVITPPEITSHQVNSPDILSAQQIIATPVDKDFASSEAQVDYEENTGVASIIDPNSSHKWQPLGHEWHPSGRPAWAEEPFDVLLVDIQGIRLAMPLASLDGIYPLEEELTSLFGQSTWFMGLQKTINSNLNVINTAQFIMPERYVKNDDVAAQYSVAINGSGWALAVDAIHQPMSVSPDDIRWRARRAERPWMAGTIKDHVCALIDIPSLANMLKQQDKNQH